MLSCRDATRLASEASDRRLSLRERLSLWQHTLICAGCRNFRRQMAFLRRAIARYRSAHDEAADDEPSPTAPSADHSPPQ